MKVIEIIEKYLIDNNYDGLYNDEYDCCCPISFLLPCGSDQSECIARYKIPGERKIK